MSKTTVYVAIGAAAAVAGYLVYKNWDKVQDLVAKVHMGLEQRVNDLREEIVDRMAERAEQVTE
jgi:hypothetical protein